MDSSSDSRMELFFTAQQPVEFELNVLTMSHEEILNLISATHVSADDNFDVDSLFVDVKKIFQRTFAIFDKLLLGQQYEEIPEEKVSTANFDPVLLCTLKELSSEMACKTPGVEIAHMTTMSILNKLPRYSWVAKAVLTLAASALVYEDFLAPTHLHSSLQRVESMEIPEQAPATLKLLDLQKYKETISKLTSTIREVNDVMRHICELNKLCNNYMKDEPSLLSYVVDDIPAGVYWTIINVVACTTQMCCLSSDEDKTQELLPLAGKECDIRYHLGSCINNCYERIEKAQTRKMKELLQTPDEIVEVFKALIFAKDDMQPLIDGSTNEMVSINVLENKYYVLLFISSLEISNDDISILKRTHDFRGNWGDSYKIVWIPIVEQWTYGLRKKFEMLRSKMPWYVVQYFSPVACIKFIKEEWHFEYKPIVVVIDEQGNVINDNAIDMIRLYGTFIRRAYPTGPPRGEYMLLQRPPGPYAIEEYTFLCGGKDNEWIKQFSEKVNVVAEDPIMKEAYISIELSCIVEGRKQRRFWKLGKTQKMPNSNPGSQEIEKLLLSLKNESRWAVLTKWSTRVVSHHGSTILKVLEAFEEWKVNVPERGFEICFKEFHDKFLQTGSQPLTPRPVEGS